MVKKSSKKRNYEDIHSIKPLPLEEYIDTIATIQEDKDKLVIIHDVYIHYLAKEEEESVLRDINVLLEVGYVEKYLWVLIPYAKTRITNTKKTIDDQKLIHSWLFSVLLVLNQQYPVTCSGQSTEKKASRWEKEQISQEDHINWSILMMVLSYLKYCDSNGINNYVWKSEEKCIALEFLIHAFQRLDISAIASAIMPYLSISIYSMALSESQREIAFQDDEALEHQYTKLMKSLEADSDLEVIPETTLIVNILQDYFDVINTIGNEEKWEKILARSLKFFLDLLNQRNTKRWLTKVLEAQQFRRRTIKSSFFLNNPPQVLQLMYQKIEDRLRPSEDDLVNSIQSFQKLLISPQYTESAAPIAHLAVLPMSTITNEKSFYFELQECLESISNHDQLKVTMIQLACDLGIFPNVDDVSNSINEIVDCFICTFSWHGSPHTDVLPLPTEMEIWQPSLSSDAQQSYFNTNKQRLQYLDFTDFLEQWISQIKMDSISVLKNLVEQKLTTSKKELWQVISPIKLMQNQYHRSESGAIFPSKVGLEVGINGEFSKCMYNKGELLVLISMYNSDHNMDPSDDENMAFPERVGLKFIRLAQVVEVKHTRKSANSDQNVVIHIEVDGQQYHEDMRAVTNSQSVYDQITHILPLKFDIHAQKYVRLAYISLKTTLKILTNVKNRMHHLQHSHDKVPVIASWLDNLFLGYGHASQVAWKQILLNKNMTQFAFDFHHYRPKTAHSLVLDHATQKVIENVDDCTGPFTYKEDLNDSSNCVIEAVINGQQQDVANIIQLSMLETTALKSAIAGGLTILKSSKSSVMTDLVQKVVDCWYRSQLAARDSVLSRDKLLLVTPNMETIISILSSVINPIHMASVSLQNSLSASLQDGVQRLLTLRLMLLEQVMEMAKWIEENVNKKDEKHLLYIPFSSSNVGDSCFHARSFQQDILSKVYTMEAIAEQFNCAFPQSTQIFKDLESLAPLEMFEADVHRLAWQFIHHVQLIVVTPEALSTHYEELKSFKVRFTNIIIDNAQDMDEIETFLPLLLSGDSLNSLILCHESTMNTLNAYQSLSTRLLRLGVVPILLDESTPLQNEDSLEEPKVNAKKTSKSSTPAKATKRRKKT